MDYRRKLYRRETTIIFTSLISYTQSITRDEDVWGLQVAISSVCWAFETFISSG